MKRALLSAALVAGLIYAPAPAVADPPQAVFYVSPSGSDTNRGTLAAPFATPERARHAVAALTPTMTGDIHVVLRGGTYLLDAPLTFGPTDSGTGGHKVSYRAYEDERPILSGGVRIAGWTRDTSVTYNRWKAPVPAGLRTRQLYVNGVRAERSRVSYGLTPANQNAPAFPAEIQQTPTGYVTNNTDIQRWRNPQQIEFVWSGQGANSSAAWMEPRCRVQSFGNSSSSTTITMRQPCFGTLQPAVKRSQAVQLPTYLENVFEFTYRGGNWYLDEPANTVYYVPRGGEDVTTATVIAPRLEQLVTLDGSHDIDFTGITFAYTTWLGPNTDAGFPEQQANIHTSGTGRAGPPGTVAVIAGRNLSFTRNVFTHLGGAGLEMRNGTQHVEVVGNAFIDISSNGIQLGGFVTRHPNPDAQDRNITIANNYLTRAGAEYSGAVGILAGYVAAVTIAHNELADLPYSAISAGWGWNADTYVEGIRIEANHVHDIMKAAPRLHDGGAIYTLGSTTSVALRSAITRNWVHGMPYVIGAIYLDSGSDHYDVTENVISESDARTWFFIATSRTGSDNVFRHNYTAHTQYQTQTNTGANTVQDNHVGLTSWPGEAQEIMAQAGLQPRFRGLTRTGTVI